ncbi:hypothetical protein QQF64_032543 [Cirrhinus molitorella]|uniref:Uncharacterized protein n=1 Tax=Cirrhinus molitorella TaxID=172907 RepID=A0ABR3N056_9TELE
MNCGGLIPDQPFELKVTGREQTSAAFLSIYAGIDIPTCNGKHAAVDKPLVIHPSVNSCVAAVKFGQI